MCTKTNFLLILHCIAGSLVFGEIEVEGGDCSLPKSPGTECPGSTPQHRWYFNQELMTCLQFKYNGCGGNANSFPDQENCNSRCVVSDGVCWGSGESGPQGTLCGSTFNCTAPFECENTSDGTPICCDRRDFTCPNGFPVFRLDHFGDNCDDLICPSIHRCLQGQFVARCCQSQYLEN